MTPTYTIVVVCHNRLELTQRCLNSVGRASARFGDSPIDAEIIVTDNASTDGTRQWLKDVQNEFTPPLRLVANPTNQGFLAPCNHALTLARGEFLVLLNNDMVVCPGWLEGLRAPFLADPRMAITGIRDTCTTISPQLVGTKGTRLDYIEGSCLMIPTALARKHGLFSTYLKFAYWEDADLSLRLREQGYHIATVSLPMNHNKRGNTTAIVPEARQHLAANTEVMKQRWGFYFKRHTFDRRILVRRLGAHGDVLLATPALWTLRQRYPEAAIDVVTKCPSMLAGLPWLGLATRKRSWYDEFHDLDLAYEKRPEVHITRAFSDALGVTIPAQWKLHMHASEADLAVAERTCRGAKVALVHPGPTCWPGKCWPAERFKEVVERLKRRGYLTIAVGTSDAPEVGADLCKAGETTPQQLYALAQNASLFVGIDSMPQHVASAANVPSVVLFGPTNPRAIVRPTPRVVAVQADTTLVPCVGEHGRRTRPVTQAPCEGECMRAVTVPMVIKAVERAEALTR
jgi:ADP-heptose:LPS heptosyltransferase/GT2 family glycosyltransferase